MVSNLYDVMDGCNGEIRLQAVRYGIGWYCLIVISEQDEKVFSMFDDLLGGDNDWFEARRYFEENKAGNVFLEIGSTPQKALSKAYDIASHKYFSHA